MKVMVTGAGGMTGSEVVRQARTMGWGCAAFNRSDLDISDFAAVAHAVAAGKPDVIVNAAAYTAVDGAETAHDDAMLVNGLGARNIARSAQANGAAVVQISTDYVFDGKADRPYLPDDLPGPINVYGESKLLGEIATREECARHAIVRTSWVYSHEGKNFVRTVLRAGSERDELKVVADQHGSPTSASDLAGALLRTAETIATRPDVAGTFHFCNYGHTTWYEIAKAIFEIRGGPAPQITPISTSEFPTAALRPAWSVLDTSSFERSFGLTPRPWRAALAETLGKIA
jgi:dTDP-4-dehydrorhamnose reductase